MNLVDEKVTHEKFGEGSVIKCNDSYVKVDFPSGERKFVFPDAFRAHLRLRNQRVADLVGEKIHHQEEKRQEKALEQKRQEALERERRQLLRDKKSIRSLQIHPRSQSVFWCEAQEQENIFTQWSVFTGEIKSGEREGQPRRLAQIKPNSACLLTIREPDMPEEDRRILGVFMVEKDFHGSQCQDGYIPAHPQYRLRLSQEESEKMLFWNYYINRRSPHNMTWNSGRQRYFDNIWMAQILRDIVSLKTRPEEREYAQEFLEYFCRMNQIKEEIPNAEGPLKNV